MAEYIARDLAIEVVAGMERPNKYLTIQYLQEIKAADVEPVRHGRWVKHAGKLICSECKKYPPMKDESGGWRTYHEWPCCPNCGAKMDGEVDT